MSQIVAAKPGGVGPSSQRLALWMERYVLTAKLPGALVAIAGRDRILQLFNTARLHVFSRQP
jgi:hypothetical protein